MKKIENENKYALPPGCTQMEVKSDSHMHYRCPKLGRNVFMELCRCSYHGRRYQLVQHLKKNRHFYNIPREVDKLFPKKTIN